MFKYHKVVLNIIICPASLYFYRTSILYILYTNWNTRRVKTCINEPRLQRDAASKGLVGAGVLGDTFLRLIRSKRYLGCSQDHIFFFQLRDRNCCKLKKGATPVTQNELKGDLPYISYIKYQGFSVIPSVIPTINMGELSDQLAHLARGLVTRAAKEQV